MDTVFAQSREDGVQLLLNVDRDIVEPARRVFASAEFTVLVKAMRKALVSQSGRIVFSGCGATGRLAVLLETMWRKNTGNPTDRVVGIITGGDFALVKSVESFEDHCEFGREQVRELDVGPEDCFVAVSEGGETSSVIGSLEEACERGARCFFVFNNPAQILRERIERARRVIDNPQITTLELFSGPMALAGSTRMQATTFEMLVLGAALEEAVNGQRLRVNGQRSRVNVSPFAVDRSPLTVDRYADKFEALLDHMSGDGIVAQIAAQIELEEETYRRGGLVTYYADEFLLDVFTDTTERTPTFMVPGFRKAGDTSVPPSWAFAKHAVVPSETAWEAMLGRAPRCLEWTRGDYARMDAPERIIESPPQINRAELARFRIGAEDDPERVADVRCVIDYPFRGTKDDRTGALSYDKPEDPLRLFKHLAVKLFFNTVSTGTMARLGRIKGNWMTFVSASNKKLIDRAVRLVADQADVSYETAADAVFEARESAAPGTSPVQAALAKLPVDNRKLSNK